jgi:hypothetical protein
MDTALSWVLVIIALVVLLSVAIRPMLAGLYWFFSVLSQGAFAFLDRFFLADLLPAIPWLLWLFWGAVIGAACGLWTLAPIYGWRRHRPLIIAAPFALLLLIFLLRALAAPQ